METKTELIDLLKDLHKYLEPMIDGEPEWCDSLGYVMKGNDASYYYTEIDDSLFYLGVRGYGDTTRMSIFASYSVMPNDKAVKNAEDALVEVQDFIDECSGDEAAELGKRISRILKRL